MKTCSCCGHPLPDDDVSALLTPMQRRLFKRVLKAGTAGIERRDLFEFVYADDVDGGPLDLNIIAVVAKNIRTRIEPHGLTIAGSRGPGSRYTVTKITQREAAHAQA